MTGVQTCALPIYEDGTFRTVTSRDADFNEVHDELVTVFENGSILVEYTFEQIREKTNSYFTKTQLEIV